MISSVLVRCVYCKRTKQVGPGEGQPFCACGGPMVAVQAVAVRDKDLSGPPKRRRGPR